ncbi:hypothetical protein FG05_35070 [Fusarium graminearum]|nr:hypothetical protein FG05_35070 [Fusarium graminearum]
MKHETRSGKRQENAQRLHIHVGISHSFSLSHQIFAILSWTRCRLAQGAWDPGACLPANERREPGSREYLGLRLFGVEAVFRLAEATETRLMSSHHYPCCVGMFEVVWGTGLDPTDFCLGKEESHARLSLEMMNWYRTR